MQQLLLGSYSACDSFFAPGSVGIQRGTTLAKHSGKWFWSSATDPLTRGIYQPFFGRWAARFARLRWMQQGMTPVYILYVLAAVVAALAWISVRPWL